MRSAYTFIEILIVISVLSIISLIAVDSYNTASYRIDFFNEMDKIQSAVNNARSQAVGSGAEGSSDEYIVEFVLTDPDQEVISYINESSDDDEIIDLSLGEDDILDIESVRFLNLGDEEWYDPLTLSGSVSLVFKSPAGTCTFKVNEDENSNESMVQLGFTRSGESDTIRYLYFHKESCLAEVLIEDLTGIDE
jgi:prepilin-type N-terminal cleavage/methylation domain-containing protein